MLSKIKQKTGQKRWMRLHMLYWWKMVNKVKKKGKEASFFWVVCGDRPRCISYLCRRMLDTSLVAVEKCLSHQSRPYWHKISQLAFIGRAKNHSSTMSKFREKTRTQWNHFFEKIRINIPIYRKSRSWGFQNCPYFRNLRSWSWRKEPLKLDKKHCIFPVFFA